ncbi:MAG: SLBB domain-containing protein [Acidobacteriota bacterium]|nr:SLBB domain-containing protein [Acidobacteriota bacterium]
MRKGFETLVLFITIGGAAIAQPSPRVSPPIDTQNANLPAQKIGPNDLIAVAVYDAPELTRTVRVSSSGQIRLPMLKQPIMVERMLPSDVEAAIAQALRTEQILIEPVVTVTMVEYHSHPISVAGAVNTPITFQAVAPITLIEAITRAGGLSKEAGSEILVSRTQSNQTDGGKPLTLTQRIPVKGLINAADPDLNITLTGGEEIRVPENGKVFVMGNVKKPGAFPVQDNSQTTVFQVLALAEGLTGTTSDQAYIYRREASGNKNEIPIDLKSLMARKTPDVPLMANDILYVPENHGKKMRMAAVEKLLLFGSTAGATALAYGTLR